MCPLCGSLETEKAFTENGCTLRVCETCELFFVDPYPTCNVQNKVVASGANPGIGILDCERRHQGERLYYERHFSMIADECEGARTLLDVGCGTGHLLARLASRPGLDRMGIELNEQAAEFARRASGCQILEVPLEEFRGERQFDVITMINVFSHIPTFDGMFRSLRAALRPEGKVILRTSEMTRDVCRWNQFHWGIPDDLHFLGSRTLDFLCAKYGFTVARHILTPCEDEFFDTLRWRQMGRSRTRNLLKSAGVGIPHALPILRQLYRAALGRRLFVSFIVLKPLASSQTVP